MCGVMSASANGRMVKFHDCNALKPLTRFTSWEKTKCFDRITDENRRREIGKQISPVYHVSQGDAPTLIIHGDADKLVPIQQAELVINRYQELGLKGKLVTKPGAAHGWPNMLADLRTIADWFDEHLAAKK